MIVHYLAADSPLDRLTFVPPDRAFGSVEIAKGGRVIEGIFIAVIAGAVLAVGGLLWKRMGSLPRVYREQREADMAMKREDAADELRALREQVVEIARSRNIVIAISSKGISPSVVTLSDGTTRYYFNDHDRYRRAMQARQVPPARSFPGKPPAPVSRWSREAVQQWLAENTD